MNESLHYPFPPARAYRLNRCLYALKSDDAFRARFLADREGALAAMGLAEDERKTVDALDRNPQAALGGLVDLGAHPYLAFMAGLRLRMDKAPTSVEYF